MAMEQKRVTLESLTRSRRGLCAFAGMGGLGAGTVAVFESENQAGTVALLSIGPISSVFALIGKIPLRWVVAGADLDMTYDEDRETADVLAEFLTEGQSRQLTQRLLEGASGNAPSVRLAANLARAAKVEAEGHARMRRLASISGEWTYLAEAEDKGADGVLTAADGRRVAVDFKAWADLPESNRRNMERVMLNSTPSILEQTGCVGLLVLTDASATTRELGELSEIMSRKLRFATFGDGHRFVLSKLRELLGGEAASSPGESGGVN